MERAGWIKKVFHSFFLFLGPAGNIIIVYQIAPENDALEGYKKRHAFCAKPCGTLPSNLLTFLYDLMNRKLFAISICVPLFVNISVTVSIEN